MNDAIPLINVHRYQISLFLYKFLQRRSVQYGLCSCLLHLSKFSCDDILGIATTPPNYAGVFGGKARGFASKYIMPLKNLLDNQVNRLFAVSVNVTCKSCKLALLYISKQK